MAAARPERGARTVAHAKRHQRAAIVEVDADPIPADGVGRHVLARPFVIEPGVARDFCVAARRGHLPSHGEMRLAVVIARLPRDRAFARETRVTMKEQLAVLPDPSVAVQVTVVDPTGKFDPEAGLHA